MARPYNEVEPRTGRWAHPAFLWLLLPFILCFSAHRLATAAEESSTDESAAASPTAEQKAKLAEHGGDMASVLVLLLGGILMMSLVAFATILIWGRRVRQSLRESPTKSKARDELWYLKPKAGLPPEETPPPTNG